MAEERRRLESECQRLTESLAQYVTKCNLLIEKILSINEFVQRKEMDEDLQNNVAVAQEYRDRLKEITDPSDFSRSKLSSSFRKSVLPCIKSYDSFHERYSSYRSKMFHYFHSPPPPLPKPPIDKYHEWILNVISQLKVYLSAQEDEIDTKKGAKNRDVRTTMRIQIKQTNSHIAKMESIKDAYLRKQVSPDAVKNSKNSIDAFIEELVTGREVKDNPEIYVQLKDVGIPLECQPLPASPVVRQGRKGVQSRAPAVQSSPQPVTPMRATTGAYSYGDRPPFTPTSTTKEGLFFRQKSSEDKKDYEYPDFLPESEVPKETYETFSSDFKQRVKSLFRSNYDQPLYHINERLPFVPYYATVDLPVFHPIGLNEVHMSYEFYNNLELELLFILFYYMPGTIVQYIAVKVLKSRGWRYQHNVVSWFRLVNQEKNEYVFFDYNQWTEMGNCQDMVRPDLFEDSPDFHFN